MEQTSWTKPVENRKDFLRWPIPVPVYKGLDLKDGDECLIEIRCADYQPFRERVKLTSGGEFFIPQPEAARLENAARSSGSSEIEFELIQKGSLGVYHEEYEPGLAQAKTLEATERLKRAQNMPRFPQVTTITTSVFVRNPYVAADVLDRAEGHCEECGQPAPFNRASDGSPYLEVHHRKRLADGGEDTVENAVALCPNCHREAHYG